MSTVQEMARTGKSFNQMAGDGSPRKTIIMHRHSIRLNDAGITELRPQEMPFDEPFSAARNSISKVK